MEMLEMLLEYQDGSSRIGLIYVEKSYAIFEFDNLGSMQGYFDEIAEIALDHSLIYA